MLSSHAIQLTENSVQMCKLKKMSNHLMSTLFDDNLAPKFVFNGRVQDYL